MSKTSLYIALACVLAACTSEEDAVRVELAALAPSPAPADNPFSEAKFELGRHLFYDVRLSLRENVACASCHRQELAFTDGQATSIGSTGQRTRTNAMSLVNSGYAATLTHANFVLTSFERQVLVPLFGEDPVEHGLSGREALALERLRAEPRYEALFAAAFPEGWGLQSVVLALATFQRGLVSARSAYDQHLAGDDREFSEAAARGEQTFRARGCPTCHGGFFFSSAMAREAVPPQSFELAVRPSAKPAGIELLTGDEGDRGRFKPPSLRNVALTAPYLHDGSLATLEDVLAAYDIAPEDRHDVLAFLESLSDYALLEDARFADPWR
ncbi:MAG TPA: cytochrome c peroxidase [Polyangiales bacterium]|nr:cytochrome c peroxidase [Polyangiales bacterium]